jgi:uncharacterized membrane protein
LRRVEQKLKETARELRRERKEPWWKFCGPKNDHESLARKLREAEERSIKIAEYQLIDLAKRMKAWDA